MRKVMIHSDGYGGENTVILDDDGKILENVTGMDIHIEAQEITRATVFMRMVQMNSEASVEAMIFTCPLCGWEGPEHKCDNTLGQPVGGPSTQIQQLIGQGVAHIVPAPVQPHPQINLNQTAWNPPLPVLICGDVQGANTCRITNSAGSHTLHVDVVTGSIWTNGQTTRQIYPGSVHHT